VDRSLFIELIHQTKTTLDSIKKFTELSRGKFSDKEFGEVFYRMITRDIEKNDLMLNSFLNYIKATTPIRKKGTVNALIEEVLRKHQVRLEEKRTKIFRTLEKDLPEAIIPDQQLRFILESVVQYAIAMMPSDGSLELSSKSVVLDEEKREDRASSNRDGNSIEVLIAFTYSKEPKERVAPQKEVVPDLILRLVDDVVKRNKGMIKFKFDETKGKMSISLKSPVERRINS
jgi:signal transduction histidine kinase